MQPFDKLRVEQKNQDARPRPLKGSTRAQHPSTALVLVYDRWVVYRRILPNFIGKSMEGI